MTSSPRPPGGHPLPLPLPTPGPVKAPAPPPKRHAHVRDAPFIDSVCRLPRARIASHVIHMACFRPCSSNSFSSLHTKSHVCDSTPAHITYPPRTHIMAGAMEVERIETLKSFPIAEDVEKNPPGLLGRGTEKGAGDLYSRVKSLERQLEFLEIRVRASEVQRRRDVDFRDVLIIRGGGPVSALLRPSSPRGPGQRRNSCWHRTRRWWCDGRSCQSRGLSDGSTRSTASRHAAPAMPSPCPRSPRISRKNT